MSTNLSLDHYRLLGRSGLRVSPLALGTMTFGQDWGWGAGKDTSRAIFDRYADQGGNFIDTANSYTDGTSEKYLGEFLKGQHDQFVLATKYTLTTRKGDPNAGGNHRKNMMQAVEASLTRLHTDPIDRLDAVSHIELGFPHDLLNGTSVRQRISGGTQLAVPRPWPA